MNSQRSQDCVEESGIWTNDGGCDVEAIGLEGDESRTEPELLSSLESGLLRREIEPSRRRTSASRSPSTLRSTHPLLPLLLVQLVQPPRRDAGTARGRDGVVGEVGRLEAR